MKRRGFEAESYGGDCDHRKRFKQFSGEEEAATTATGSSRSLQISESTIELMKEITITEVPGIRGKAARDLFRKGYVHMYFLAKDFLVKFEADELKFQDWLKKSFQLSAVDANRATRALKKTLFEENLAKPKKCSTRKCRCHVEILETNSDEENS